MATWANNESAVMCIHILLGHLSSDLDLSHPPITIPGGHLRRNAFSITGAGAYNWSHPSWGSRHHKERKSHFHDVLSGFITHRIYQHCNMTPSSCWVLTQQQVTGRIQVDNQVAGAIWLHQSLSWRLYTQEHLQGNFTIIFFILSEHWIQLN